MTWFRVDDTLAAHPKVRKAGLPAMGLWVVAGAYCGQQLTDGFVPEWFVTSWPQGKKLAAQLVSAGLWLPAVGEDPGYQFHEWQQSNPTRAQVLKQREDAAKRSQQWREKHRASDGTFGERDASRHASRNASRDATPTRPDPTRPVVVVQEEEEVQEVVLDSTSELPQEVRDMHPTTAYGDVEVVDGLDLATVTAITKRLAS